eukprot:GDKJ01007101.1.p1 GENE.GDKJ01007101.1~~GDKJ01007101.1.p1  ORF type:complete len:461 (-),score=109.61 GDKJ01007101.1:4-1323(-)
MNQGWTNNNFKHEISLGMTQFFRESQEKGGIPCSLKTVSEDFHVHEIDTNGNILHLTELYSKKQIQDAIAKARADEAGAGIVSPDFSITGDFRVALEAVMTPSDIDRLVVFVKALAGEMRETKVVAHPTIHMAGNYPNECAEDETARKSFRTLFHQTVKEHLPFLASEAVDAMRDDPIWATLPTEDVSVSSDRSGFRVLRLRPTTKCLKALQISIELPPCSEPVEEEPKDDEPPAKKGRAAYWDNKKAAAKAKRGGRGGSGAADGGKREYAEGDRWPKNRPAYNYFLLYKKMRETVNAQSVISKVTNRPARTFAFAGMKDRRASTVQMMSGHKASPEALLQALTHNQWDSNLRVQPVTFKDGGLFLGSLVGNHFRIVLRDVSATSAQGQDTTDVLASLVEKLAKNGYINYFGSQRFGTGVEIRSHHVGAALLVDKFNFN